MTTPVVFKLIPALMHLGVLMHWFPSENGTNNEVIRHLEWYTSTYAHTWSMHRLHKEYRKWFGQHTYSMFGREDWVALDIDKKLKLVLYCQVMSNTEHQISIQVLSAAVAAQWKTIFNLPYVWPPFFRRVILNVLSYKIILHVNGKLFLIF